MVPDIFAEDVLVPDTRGITLARADPRLIKLREDLITSIEQVSQRWPKDIEISSVRNRLPSFQACSNVL